MDEQRFDQAVDFAARVLVVERDKFSAQLLEIEMMNDNGQFARDEYHAAAYEVCVKIRDLDTAINILATATCPT